MATTRERTGVIARKLGMTRVFAEGGEHIPVTLLSLDGCQVVGVRTNQDRQVTTEKNGEVTRNDGYTAVVMGLGERKAKRISKAQREQFSKAEVAPKAKCVEFRVSGELPEVGAEVQADHFIPGQKIDVSALTKGRGFAGGMKRWNFAGLRASHGVSISHRSHGSTGQCQDPGRVFKGKKMAGHYGTERRTVQNLEVVRTDVDRGLIYVKGAVPGHKGTVVEVFDAIKRTRPAEAPNIGSFKSENSGADGQEGDQS